MLNFKDKIQIFLFILDQKELSYADSFNVEIGIYSENHDFKFLKELNSEIDIVNWIKKLKSRIVMKEHVATSQDIIDDYILCG